MSHLIAILGRKGYVDGQMHTCRLHINIVSLPQFFSDSLLLFLS